MVLIETANKSNQYLRIFCPSPEYNYYLQRRIKRNNTIDHILLEEIDESNERLMRIMVEISSTDEIADLVFQNDDLTWNVVTREPSHMCRTTYNVAIILLKELKV